MRRAPRGSVPPAAPGGAYKRAGRCLTGSPHWQPPRNAKRSLPGRAGSRDKMVPFSDPELQWRDVRGRQGSGWLGLERVLVPREEAPAGGGSQPVGSWAGRLRRRQCTHTHTRALAAAVAAAAAAVRPRYGIKGEAPPNRVSSPRTLPQQRW